MPELAVSSTKSWNKVRPTACARLWSVIALPNGSEWALAMRNLTLLLCVGLRSCSYFAEPLEISSAHFHIVADTSTSSEEEMRALLEQGEAFHAAIRAIAPPDVRWDPTIKVRLHGDYRSEVPYVDREGTIHLWSYPPELGGYEALFAHELVHAIAFDAAVEMGVLKWPFLGFYNEGWAEYVALLIDPDKTGFPFYGFDEDVVVGHWVAHGGLSLAALRTAHGKLNTCWHQAYTMRASWFRYVDEVYGRDVMLDVIYTKDGFAPEVVEAVLGRNLDEVDADWRAWCSARYAAHPSADAEAEAYRAFIGGYVPCVE